MKVYIEKRKNSVLCNECHAFKGNPENDIDYVYVIRVGNNTMSFCERCMDYFVDMVHESCTTKEDIEYNL